MGSAEVRPLRCTGAGVSQGGGGCKPKGDLIAASSSYSGIYPISIKRFAPLGRVVTRFQKQVKL